MLDWLYLHIILIEFFSSVLLVENLAALLHNVGSQSAEGNGREEVFLIVKEIISYIQPGQTNQTFIT